MVQNGIFGVRAHFGRNGSNVFFWTQKKTARVRLLMGLIRSLGVLGQLLGVKTVALLQLKLIFCWISHIGKGL